MEAWHWICTGCGALSAAVILRKRIAETRLAESQKRLTDAQAIKQESDNRRESRENRPSLRGAEEPVEPCGGRRLVTELTWAERVQHDAKLRELMRKLGPPILMLTSGSGFAWMILSRDGDTSTANTVVGCVTFGSVFIATAVHFVVKNRMLWSRHRYWISKITRMMQEERIKQDERSKKSGDHDGGNTDNRIA